MTPHSNNHHLKKLPPGAPGLSPNTAMEAEESLSQEELAEVWARRAYTLAELPPAETTGQRLDLLVFRLSHEQYGLEVTHIREIYPLEQLTPVPRTPDFVVGIFSARGRLISVIELRAFLGLPTPSFEKGAKQTKIIVVATAELEVGLLADEIDGLLTISKDKLEPLLTTQMSAHTEFAQGIAPGMVVVLNLKALLSDKRLIIYQGDEK
jgi:purine-binding chemotaxis protein CheW